MLAFQNHYSYIHIGHREPTWNTLPQHPAYVMYRPFEQTEAVINDIEPIFGRPAKRKYDEIVNNNSVNSQQQQEEQRQKVQKIEIPQSQELTNNNSHNNHANEEFQQQNIIQSGPTETHEQQYYKLALESPHLLMPSFPNLPLTPRNLALILREQMAAMQIREQLLQQKLLC